MAFITIDLGTTNIKVTAFSDCFEPLCHESEKVLYQGTETQVEFDAALYFDHLLYAISRVAAPLHEPVRQIVLTGQAESLVVLDDKYQPMRPAISWLDTRSSAECEDLKKAFPEEKAYRITGQPANTPTWPITKILWLKKHEPRLFQRANRYVLLKDYILYRLTGILLGEYSIYNFSYYFDINKKDYWMDMLNWCGIRRDQLPDLVEPCTVIGPILKQIAGQAGLDCQTTVNIGTLDHFAGMIGTGNIKKGIISESTGTVLTLATFSEKPILTSSRIPCHCGPFADSYVLLPVCESGGISLDWFKESFAENLSYEDINQRVAQKKRPGDLIFLPFLTGTNSPDYEQTAKGVFYGLRLHHDQTDCALAVMEGVAYLLYRNLICLKQNGIEADRIITTGGGSRSAIWCQLKADLTGYSFSVPVQTEAASLGCALIGAVTSGLIKDYAEGVDKAVSMKRTYTPALTHAYQPQIRLSDKLFEQLIPVFHLDAQMKEESG